MYNRILKLETYPYSEEFLKWDEQTRKYTLTKECVLKFLGIDLNEIYKTEENVNYNLIRISNNFYDYIYNTSCVYNDLQRNKKDILEYIYAKDYNYRNKIREGLLKFTTFDESTDEGTSAEYFGMDNAIPKNITAFLINSNLINYAQLCYKVEATDEDFKERNVKNNV